ncbi:MAG: hypothetical protein IK102_04885 [Treponema sp.]|nr:hypothetical protein [Treponema sp.]
MKEYKINQIEKKRILGRNVYKNNDESLTLFWGGAALEVNIKAREIWACISTTYVNLEQWLAVEVNGAQISRFMLNKDKTWYCLARNMNPEKENLITIIKDTQPLNEDPTHSLVIHAIGLDEAGEFVPVAPRSCKIEFIGDSITAGEGTVGAPDEMDWISQWMSASKTYAMQTAKMINADWNTMGKSGWGICWAWDGNRDCKIPPHYEQVCSVLKDDNSVTLGSLEKWDFNSGHGSDYVVINLGTNDESGMKVIESKEALREPQGPQEAQGLQDGTVVPEALEGLQDGTVVPEALEGLQEEIVSSVKNFLTVIRSHNPSAKILWCWGLLKLHVVPGLIQKGVEEYKAESGDQNVFTLELESLDELEKTPEEKGSRGHPGYKTHHAAALKIVEFLTTL